VAKHFQFEKTNIAETMKTLYLSHLSFLIFIVLFNSFGSSAKAQAVLIDASSSWKYLDDGSDQGTAWRAANFNDASWNSGPAELGFGNSPVTELAASKIGYYFRKTVNITNPLQYSDFTMNIRRDDGIVVYVNNVELYRNNMPAGIINYNTPASSTCSDDGNLVLTISLPNTVFVNGDNTIAAEVHNRRVSSSDITFELALLANSATSCGVPDVNLFGNRNKTTNSAEVFWVTIPGAVSYNVSYRIRNSGASYSAPINTNSTFVVLNNLLPATNYEFIVQSVCAGNAVSPYSASGWFTTLTAPSGTCAAPNYLLFGNRNKTSSSAEVFWVAVPAALSYNVSYRIRNSGAAYSTAVNTTATAIVLANLQASTNYEFIVQTVCSGTQSAYSASGWFTTLTTSSGTCAIPDYLLFGNRNKTENSAEVFWVAVPGALSYNISYRIRNSGATYSTAVNTTATAIVLANLQASTNYEFIVQTVCNGGQSAYSVSGWFTTLNQSPTNPTLARGPYMSPATSTGTTIQWRTSFAVNSEVKYGTSAGQLNQVATDLSTNTEHALTLNNLLPGTKYFYSIGSVGHVLQGDINNYFYTAPADNSIEPVRFWALGDFGSAGSRQTAVRNSFTNYSSGQIVNGWIWLGDNAYDFGTDQEYQTHVFDVYNSIAKNTPIFPTLGNHDYALSGYQSSAALGHNFPYFDIFKLPGASGTEKYYSVNYGSIHFISLDSYGSYNDPSSAMYNWLSNDLANNTQQWTIVYLHSPPYTKGSHDSDSETGLIDVRNNIVPLLESYGVDLVLSGHSHNYERSNFIKGHTGLENSFNPSIYPAGNIVQPGGGPYTKSTRTGNGTVYVVCGVGALSTGSTQSGFPHNAMYKSNITDNGSLILDVDGGSLSCKFLTATGIIDDEFEIQKPILTPGPQPRASRTIEHSENTVSVYPNPSSGDVNISLNNLEAGLVSVSISNMAGKVQFKRTFLSAKDQNILIEKPESNLSSGVYLVNVIGENINTSNKLIVY
jgi:predicted MPP superfamily phosphohydrolase